MFPQFSQVPIQETFFPVSFFSFKMQIMLTLHGRGLTKMRASEHSSSFCEQFEQRPNVASTFKLNGTIRYPLPSQPKRIRAARLTGLLRCAEMIFRPVLHKASQPGWSVDVWCDEPWETEASLILFSHWLYKPGWLGKRDYIEKSQPG